MVLFFQIMVWCIVAGLGLYVYATWRFEAKVKEKMSAIRKTWYLLFVLGAMVYWTYEPLPYLPTGNGISLSQSVLL